MPTANDLVSFVIVLLTLTCLVVSGTPLRHEQDTFADSREGDSEELPVLGWQDPRTNGGRMLDFTTRRYGEPLNVIISAHSDAYIMTDPGLRKYSRSLGFSDECLGLHYGAIHFADLGDGDGRKPEEYLARQTYFPVLGSCWESVAGGNHFRAWKQNGKLVDSGAWFLGVSFEEDSSKHHKIAVNGYNRGRDWLVERATSVSHYGGIWWKAEVEWNESDLLLPGKEGVNHNITQDGRVAILTVKRLWSSSVCDQGWISSSGGPIRLLEVIFRCLLHGWHRNLSCFQTCGIIPIPPGIAVLTNRKVSS